jgi:hypothetical protein
MSTYALEASPGKLTASFPTFDNYEDAVRAATVPAMYRPGVPDIRILVRTEPGPWSLHSQPRHPDRKSDATVTRIRSKSGNPDADYWQAVCTCGWASAMSPNRTIEGRRLATRDAGQHRCHSSQAAS